MDIPEESARVALQQSSLPDIMVQALLELYAINKAGYTAEVTSTVLQTVFMHSTLEVRQIRESGKYILIFMEETSLFLYLSHGDIRCRFLNYMP